MGRGGGWGGATRQTYYVGKLFSNLNRREEKGRIIIDMEISFKLSGPGGDDAGTRESMNGTAANGKYYGERGNVEREI